MFNIPNFITSKRIIGKVLNLSNKTKNILENKIVLIENADPDLIGFLQRKSKVLLHSMEDLILIWL